MIRRWGKASDALTKVLVFSEGAKMEKVNDILADYRGIAEQTHKNAPKALNEIDRILDDIRSHIRGIDKEVFSRRNELLIAIRLVEAFRIFNWIKVCLACGSYQSVLRELRFMLDGVAQACYIDLNHCGASLVCKLEVYKALGDVGGFIESTLFDRHRGFEKRQDLKELYSELSRFVHPSIEESRRWIERARPDESIDSLKFNRFDKEILDWATGKCKEVGRMLVSVDDYFIKQYLSKIKSEQTNITNAQSDS
jgi:hypothetical protein